MFTKSALIAAVAVAAIGIASPAFAQAYSKGWGTGNLGQTYYDSDGGLHLGAVPSVSNTQIAAGRTGSNALAQARQPDRQEAREFRHGDFYVPSKTAVQPASPREQSAFRQGDFYAPTVD
jgi:hypothetical protein